MSAAVSAVWAAETWHVDVRTRRGRCNKGYGGFELLIWDTSLLQEPFESSDAILEERVCVLK